MIEVALQKGLYDRLVVGEIEEFLAGEAAGGFHIVIAADVFAYMAGLEAVCGAVSRVLAPGGVFGFTVETHAGEGVIVGEKMRYAHGADFVRAAVDRAGLTVRQIAPASSRTENRKPVPGLLVIAQQR
jgi:predicted TPR repeat methyltransferase